MTVRAVAVYRRTVRCVLTGSRGKIAVSKRAWLVLQIGARLEAVGISAKAFRMLRKEGVPLTRRAIHELRKLASCE